MNEQKPDPMRAPIRNANADPPRADAKNGRRADGGARAPERRPHADVALGGEDERVQRRERRPREDIEGGEPNARHDWRPHWVTASRCCRATGAARAAPTDIPAESRALSGTRLVPRPASRPSATPDRARR